MYIFKDYEGGTKIHSFSYAIRFLFNNTTFLLPSLVSLIDQTWKEKKKKKGRGCGMPTWCDDASHYFYSYSVRISRVVLARTVFPVEVYNWQRQCDFGYIAYVNARAIVEWLEDDSSGSMSNVWLVTLMIARAKGTLETPTMIQKRNRLEIFREYSLSRAGARAFPDAQRKLRARCIVQDQFGLHIT